MTVNDFYNEVSRKVDTGKTQINAAETKRVLSEAFKVLAALPTAEAFDLVAKAVGNAAKKHSSIQFLHQAHPCKKPKGASFLCLESLRKPVLSTQFDGFGGTTDDPSCHNLPDGHCLRTEKADLSPFPCLKKQKITAFLPCEKITDVAVAQHLPHRVLDCLDCDSFFGRRTDGGGHRVF